MKWLFAVLVALNIIVFGGMVFSKMAVPQQHAAAPTHNAPAAQPTVVQIHTGSNGNTSDTPPAADTKPTATPARRNENKPAAEQPAAARNGGGIQTPATACTATAVLAEDDYHRIKGLLSRWPHSASRVTERRQTNRATSDRYRLSVAAEGDVQALRERLKTAGFPNAAISGGKAVLGTFNSEQQAERAAARARQAGMSPEIVRTGSNGGEQSAALGESKVQLTFVEVNNEAAAGISGIIGRYSPLRRAPCNRR